MGVYTYEFVEFVVVGARVNVDAVNQLVAADTRRRRRRRRRCCHSCRSHATTNARILLLFQQTKTTKIRGEKEEMMKITIWIEFLVSRRTIDLKLGEKTDDDKVQ